MSVGVASDKMAVRLPGTVTHQGAMMDAAIPSEHILFVTLPQEPLPDSGLTAAIRTIGSGQASHVVVDFSRAAIISSGTVCHLIILERLVAEVSHQLVLCSVPTRIRKMITRVGLQALFRFANDRRGAVELLRGAACKR